MSTTETHHPLWVAYGPSGVVGSIRKDDDGYTVTMAGADAAAGTLPLDGGRQERAALADDAGQRLARVPRALSAAVG